MKPSEAIELLKNMKWSITTKFNAVNNSTKALDLAISTLKKQEQDRWISVKDRLPEYGTEVLTQLSDDDIVVNWVIDEEDEEWLEDGVIAWRPLPELYEGL